MEKPIDALRVKMWIDRFEEASFRLRDAQEQCSFLASECHKLKEENLRLQGCLQELVDAGTQYLAFSQPIVESDGSRGAQFREVIEIGRKEINE
nr:MAG TPA: hypothetical protein [Caudoviricetes sp.]